MHERMLDKQSEPTLAEMTAYCGDSSKLFTLLNDWLGDTYGTERTIVFPYGNKYGWGVAHRRKKELVCNVFAESGSFTVMLRATDAQFASVYGAVRQRTREYIDNRYPCGSGGWIHYRVECAGDLVDVKTILATRCAKAQRPAST